MVHSCGKCCGKRLVQFELLKQSCLAKMTHYYLVTSLQLRPKHQKRAISGKSIARAANDM
eukprot:1155333-Pelagomonas_calceolata.AAC.8